jgi:glycosyltransferase involved in cell wall biosynthesis
MSFSCPTTSDVGGQENEKWIIFNRMRVGLVVFANKWTGAGAVAELSCRALHAAGLDARLLFVGGRNLERRLGGRPWAVPGLVKERRPAHLRSNFRAINALAAASDAVVCYLPHDHFLCVAAGAHRRVPLVRAFRNPRHIRRDPYHRWLARRLSAALLPYPALGTELRRIAGRLPATTLPVPVEDRFTPTTGSGRRARLGIPESAPVVGAVGKLASGRGFDLLLDAASRIDAPVHVVVVGHGELLPRIQERAVRLGLERRVHWTGYQDEALPELYAAMEVVLFIAPGSDWGHRSISEAQGCGRPVVAVRYPGVEDLIDDGVNGRVANRDPDSLAATVQSLLADREAARRIGASAGAAVVARRMVPVGRTLARFFEEKLPETATLAT